MILYHYWRSSSSWRIRLALKFKQQEVHFVPINLLNGESESPEHLKRNALGFVPVLEYQGKYLIESRAIIEWLEEKFPERPLLPVDAIDRAHVRSLIDIVASDIQPIQNLTVLDKVSSDPEIRKQWSQYFIARGLNAYEKICKPQAGRFSYGNQLTMADFFLVPQIYNAFRFEVDMSTYPLLKSIYEEAMKLPIFIETCPEKFQPS